MLNSFSKHCRLGVSVAAAILASAVAADAQTFVSGDTPIGIIDNNTITSTINVPNTFTAITDVNVLIDANHSWVGDLTVSVTSPQGTTVRLFNRPNTNNSTFGFSSDLVGAYIFDDAAATSFDTVAASNPVVPGTYSPGPFNSDQLAAFNNEDPLGIWTMSVQDSAGGDTGTLNFWRLILTLQAIDQAIVSPAVQAIISGNARTLLGNLQDRKTASFSGGREATASQSNPFAGGKFGLWARAGGSSADADGAITNLFTPGVAKYNSDLGFIQNGVSFNFYNDGASRMIASVFGHYAFGNSTINNAAGALQGRLKTRSGGIGGGATWLMNNGFYADVTGIVTWHDIDSTTASGATGSTNGTTIAGSIEAGFKMPINSGFSLTPQAQLVYQRTKVDAFTDSGGTTVAFNAADHLEGRLGIALEHVSAMHAADGILKVNGSVNVVHDFTNDSGAIVNATPLGFKAKGTELMLTGGATLLPNIGGLKMGAQGSYSIALNNEGRQSFSLSAILGFDF